MISSFVRALVSAFKARRELALEKVGLRQQLAVLRRSVKRPRLSNGDREFLVLLRRIWTDWESASGQNNRTPSCPKTQTNSRLRAGSAPSSSVIIVESPIIKGLATRLCFWTRRARVYGRDNEMNYYLSQEGLLEMARLN